MSVSGAKNSTFLWSVSKPVAQRFFNFGRLITFKLKFNIK